MAAEYTQLFEQFTPTAEGAWTTLNLLSTYSIPAGAVVEIICEWTRGNSEGYVGVRTNGSSLDRYVQLHESETNVAVHCRMFVKSDASGIIEYWTDNDSYSYFYIVGYWTGIDFTEMVSQHYADSTSTWVDETLSAGPSLVHHLAACNLEENNNTVGARANGSSIERKLVIHEAEGGGISCLDFLVKADSSSIIELYATDNATDTVYFLDLGYFSSALDFVELWQPISAIGGTWYTVDVTAYLDEDGRVCDVMLKHDFESQVWYMGTRDGDDTSTERRLGEHEAESAGAGDEYTGFSMSAQSNADGLIYIFGCNVTGFAHLAGYYKPGAVGAIYSTYMATDTLLQKLGLTKSLATDILFASLGMKDYLAADVFFTLNKNKQLSIDTLIKRLGIPKELAVDILLRLARAEEIDVDVLLLGEGSTSLFIDTYLIEITAKAYSTDALIEILGIDTKAAIDALIQGLQNTELAIGAAFSYMKMIYMKLDSLLEGIQNSDLAIDAKFIELPSVLTLDATDVKES